MNIELAYSPCPNDTFIFDAWVHGRINDKGVKPTVTLNDVEELNRAAFLNGPDVTKLSFHAYAYISGEYQLLTAGSALGEGCGPLLIAKQELTETDLASARVAIPGKYTTANLLYRLAYPDNPDAIPYLFSDIEQAVLDDEVDAGVIIHENRFTYSEKGLVKLADLGEIWEKEYKVPVPLGGIAVKRHLPQEIKLAINENIRASLQYARQHPEASMPYVSLHAQEMEPTVMQQHIDLYVNEYSLDLGQSGKEAIERMYRTGREKGFLPALTEPVFLL
jgi:1,4-dihydroxy-6-naphthoate synthase